MKKIICVILLLAVLAGCGSKNVNENTEDKEMIVLHFTGDCFDRDIEIEKGSSTGNPDYLNLSCKVTQEGMELDYYIYTDSNGNSFDFTKPVNEEETITVEAVMKEKQTDEEKDIPVESIEISKLKQEQGKSILYIRTGDSYKLNPAVKPANASNKTLSYYCSDESVLKITDKGEVKALECGISYITVTAKNGVSASIEAYVYDTTINLETTTASKEGASGYYVGDTVLLDGKYTKYTDTAIINYTGLPKDAKIMIIEGPDILKYEDRVVTVTANPKSDVKIRFRLVVQNENLYGVSNAVDITVNHK